jgi:hypothetical protein
MRWLHFNRRERDAAQANASRMEQLAIDYRVTFQTPAGQAVLADLLARNFVGQATFVAGAPDVTAFNEGRRRAVLELVAMINRNPDAVPALLRTGETEGLFNG